LAGRVRILEKPSSTTKVPISCRRTDLQTPVFNGLSASHRLTVYPIREDAGNLQGVKASGLLPYSASEAVPIPLDEYPHVEIGMSPREKKFDNCFLYNTAHYTRSGRNLGRGAAKPIGTERAYDLADRQRGITQQVVEYHFFDICLPNRGKSAGNHAAGTPLVQSTL
jgi:hypothetical protein